MKAKLFSSDKSERYFHIFYSYDRKAAEVSAFTRRIGEVKAAVKVKEGCLFVFSGQFAKYFDLFYDEKDGRFMFGIDKPQVIEEELKLCRYFVVVTSEKKSAEGVILLYKSRDVSEKLFRGDESYLGNNALRYSPTKRPRTRYSSSSLL